MANAKLNDETLRQTTVILDGKIWRPITKLTGLGNTAVQDSVVKLQKTVAPVAPAGTNGVTTGAPKHVTNVVATESPSKQQDRTFSEVSVTFLRDGSDKAFGGVRIWFTGYKANTNPVLMTDGHDSPLSFLCETTGETVVVTVQAIGADGTTADFTSAPSTSVVLDGVISAPPAPSISQSLTGTPLGYQFSFNEVSLLAGTQDVIQGYRVYRNTVNLSGSAALIQVIPHDPTATGAITVTDHIQDASGTFYYYWVSSVNTVGLESTKTAAQSGDVIGSVGSLPAVLSTPFKIVNTTTTTTFSTSPTAYFTRADGSVTQIGQTSNTITGLPTNNTSFFFPYWRESDQTLQFVGFHDVPAHNISGYFFNFGGVEWMQTVTSGSIPSSFSVECWFDCSTAANQPLLSFSSPQGTGAVTNKVMQAFVTSAGEVEFAIWNGSVWKTVVTSGASCLDSSTHHIVCAYDATVGGGTMTVYVDSANTSDGITFWTTASAGTVSAATGFWHIGFVAGVVGAPITANTFANGSVLSNIAVYPSALDSAAVSSHFIAMVNLGVPSFAQEVVYDGASYYWKMDSLTTTEADSIGSNTGTRQSSGGTPDTFPVVVPWGTGPFAWPYSTLAVLQFQCLKNHTPLSSGGIPAKTTSSGTTKTGGGGSGSGTGSRGGRGGCFTANTLVKTRRGDIPIKDVQPGDQCLTAAGTWRQVLSRDEHEAEPRELHDMGNDEWVTFDHHVLKDGRWTRAGNIFRETKTFNEPVYTLSMLSGEDLSLALSPRTERSFMLSSGLLVTNLVVLK